MWKTLGGFSAQISRFQHILPLSTAQINCSGSDLPFFRKPYIDAHLLASARLSHCRLWTQDPCLAAVAQEQGLAAGAPEL
jgi:hypothetical protein